ncbi:hypothetical protein B0H21DRAFT_306037 [Amylocystis lapponica]|nr:hypothetical protein B0H21DRAFT_306037 [Amylocystis lapponica]
MSTRPPPRAGSYSVVSRVYSSNLRPIVIVIGGISAIWSLIWAVGAFESISVDKDHGQTKLATFAIVLGSIYIATCAIEIFGVTAAATQRATLIRIYALLSVVGSFSIVGAALMKVIIHFLLKNDLISECEQVVQGSTVYYQFGLWGPTYKDKLTAEEAVPCAQCIPDLLPVSTLKLCSARLQGRVEPRLLRRDHLPHPRDSHLRMLYRNRVRVLQPSAGPTHAANVSRMPVATGDGAYPQHYNPAYLSYDAPAQPYAVPQYDPPPGPPPADDYDTAKPPVYSEEHGYGGPAGRYGAEKDDKDDPFADFEGAGGPHNQNHDALV